MLYLGKILSLLFEDVLYPLIIEINVILSRGYCSIDEGACNGLSNFWIKSMIIVLERTCLLWYLRCYSKFVSPNVLEKVIL
jgi:hypothetical protein